MVTEEYISKEKYLEGTKKINRRGLATMALGGVLMFAPLFVSNSTFQSKHPSVQFYEILSERCGTLESISRGLKDAGDALKSLPPTEDSILLENLHKKYSHESETCQYNDLKYVKEDPEVKKYEEIKDITQKGKYGSMIFGALIFGFGGIGGVIRRDKLRKDFYNSQARNKPLKDWPKELP